MASEHSRVRGGLPDGPRTCPVSRFLNLVSGSGHPLKKKRTFLVRHLGSIGGHHSTAEVNIIINEIDASINLYAQFAKLAELRPKQDRLRLSAGAPSPAIHISYE